MRVSDETVERLAETRIRRNEARDAVISWMSDAGRAGRLRRNYEAPGWEAYKAAEDEWAAALSAFDAEVGRCE